MQIYYFSKRLSCGYNDIAPIFPDLVPSIEPAGEQLPLVAGLFPLMILNLCICGRQIEIIATTQHYYRAARYGDCYFVERCVAIKGLLKRRRSRALQRYWRMKFSLVYNLPAGHESTLSV